MKARGIRGGILLRIEPDDDVESLRAALVEHRELLAGKVSVELAARLDLDVVDLIRETVTTAGGTLQDLRPPTAVEQVRAETKIIARTVRSGGRVESSGSVVVLGDVNAGAEIVAGDDIIVTGTLRGLAHAGAQGNERAVVWAQRIRSPQLRIGSAVAQGDVSDDARDGGAKDAGPEVALLRDGQIAIRPWNA